MKPLLSMVVVACCLATGCARPGSDKFKEPSPIEALAVRDILLDPAAKSRSRGRNVFKHYCSICHGDEGKGDGFNSTNLTVPPRDFSSPEFWRRTADEHLLRTVSRGGLAVGKSVLMPAWGHTLNDRQMRDTVAFLHTLAAEGEPTADDSCRPTGLP
ncbi:MAG: c-type cytochrome [Planctomycetia bacterium]|nr:c-type cytochrome [Planctomycetia bacterium]